MPPSLYLLLNQGVKSKLNFPPVLNNQQYNRARTKVTLQKLYSHCCCTGEISLFDASPEQIFPAFGEVISCLSEVFTVGPNSWFDCIDTAGQFLHFH